MAKKRAGKTDNFVWTDEEVEMLLQTTLDYKATKAQEGVDWESCLAVLHMAMTSTRTRG